jgi:hypothetical protein
MERTLFRQPTPAETLKYIKNLGERGFLESNPTTLDLKTMVENLPDDPNKYRASCLG